jgi:hypothetical protein
MNFRGSNVQPQRYIVESAGANPADAVLDRMEDGEKTMPAARSGVKSSARVSDWRFADRPVNAQPLAALPA